MHRRLLALTRRARLGLSLTVASSLLAGLLTVGQAWLISLTVNGVFLERRTLAQVAGWMQMLLLVIAARGLLAWLNEAAASAVAVRIKDDLRRRFFSRLLSLGPSYTRSRQTGDLAVAANQSIEALDAYYSQYLPQLFICAILPPGILFIVFPLDLLSGLILLLTAPLIPFFMYMIGRDAGELTGRQYETLSRLSAHFLDSLQGLTTLKLFGQSRAQAANIASISERFRSTTLKVLQVTFLSAFALELLSTLGTALIAVEVGLRLLYGRMEFIPALFILVLAPEFYLPLRMLGQRFHAGMAGTSAAQRIFQVLDTPLPAPPASPRTSASSSLTFKSLTLSGISHTYLGTDLPALDHLDLEIHPGEHIAIVGPSGAGKSTLASLLLRFFEPSQGRLLVNGTALPLIPVGNWRDLIAWVPQNPSLFHATFAANLRIARPGASDEELTEAARLAHLHDFIESLPLKYETSIGEGGARLSSGQGQRLALARAFLKNAPILLLDEPTSSLDPATESLLEDSTRRLMQGRTVITIAHRLNTIFRADRILLLDQGRIVESGTHRELLERSGLYAQMVASRIGSPGSAELPPPAPEAWIAASPSSPAPVSSPGGLPSLSRRPLLRLLGFLNGSWGWVALSVLLSTLTVASSLALMGTSAWLISMAALQPSIAALGVSVVAVRFFGIARGLFRYLERLVSHNVTFRLLARLRLWFYERLEPLAPARLMEFRSGDLLARIVGDVETLENFYIRLVSPPLAAVVIAAGATLFLASFSTLAALLLLCLFLLLGLLLPLLSQLLSRRDGETLIRQRAELHTLVVDGVQGLADLLAFNRGPQIFDQLSLQSRLFGLTQTRLARLTGLFSGLGVFLTNFGLWLVLWVCIPLVQAERLQPVMLAPLALLSPASFEAVTPLPLAAQMWSQVRAAARRLFEVVDAPPAVKDLPAARTAPRLKEGPPEIKFDDLGFTYPGGAAPALEGIGFRLEPGRSLAIVGPSGAGKSTLASLLLRFWEYSSGDIRLNGRPLRDFPQEEVRARIGLIPPSSHFFDTTVRENLRLARRGVTQAEIESAARQACIHEFILRLPNGYDTLIGERGLRLSGGERQRLAIARALLKDAPCVIFDEPTANLDPLTEAQVLQTLLEMMRGRTALLITHRLIGLENMDGILVLDGGRILERGTHASLLARGGLYRRMWDLQNRALVEGC